MGSQGRSRARRAVWAATGALVLTLAACGGGDDGTTDGAATALPELPEDRAPSTTTAARQADTQQVSDEPRTLCDTITPEEVSDLLGTRVEEGSAGHTIITDSHRCVFEAPNKARLTLQVSEDFDTVEAFDEQMGKIGATEPIADLGERAYMDETAQAVRVFVYADGSTATVAIRGAASPTSELRDPATELARGLTPFL